MEKEEIVMADKPIFIIPVDGPPPVTRRGPKPGTGRIQTALREARNEGVDRWVKFPNVCKASFQRCVHHDAEFRGAIIRTVKRPVGNRHDVYVMFPSGGGR